MNFLTDTKLSLKDSLQNYMCLRMRFRGTVLAGEYQHPASPADAAAYVFEAKIKHWSLLACYL